MKTKLLKKVRKRYEIVRVDKNDDPKMDYYNFRTPFYILRDNKNWYRGFVRKCYSKEYTAQNEYELNMVKEKLMEWIKKDYAKTSKKVLYKETKVWHV